MIINLVKIIIAVAIVFASYIIITDTNYADRTAQILAYGVGVIGMIGGMIFAATSVMKLLPEFGKRINFVPDDGLNTKQQSRQLEPSTHTSSQANEKLKGGQGPVTRA
jgi:hypothetical protein